MIGIKNWRTGAVLRTVKADSLRGADLRGADLRGADLIEANLIEASLPHFQIPQEGDLIVWKAVHGGIAKLRIPAEAKRTASLVGRKCRAEYVEVLALEPARLTEAPSKYDASVVYRVGEIVRPHRYDDDIRVECAAGIHFFLTKEEAVKW